MKTSTTFVNRMWIVCQSNRPNTRLDKRQPYETYPAAPKHVWPSIAAVNRKWARYVMAGAKIFRPFECSKETVTNNQGFDQCSS